jgi:glycosyltransferase involved in cell wall biosynthesis
MEERFDFTVIVPHYRSFAGLERLLSTVPLDLPSVQVIVIDDHSGDPVQLSAMQEKYPSVVFLDARLGAKGAGAARNEGLRRALGKWLLFADADDYFRPGAFAALSASVNSADDVVYFPPCSERDGTSDPGTRHWRYAKLVEMYRETQNPLIRYRFVVPWSKMIRRKLVVENGILFSEVLAANDVMFSLKTGHAARGVSVSDEIIYCVTERSGSLTQSYSEPIFDARFEVATEHNRFLAQHAPHLTGPSMLRFVLRSFRFGPKKALQAFLAAWNSGFLVLPRRPLSRFSRTVH